ncbi:MAG: PAS domain S-box protein [Alphaproteobacteria bacterium]|nr:PAS domain S-box protein [Alphaproteobacteria bacterium]
MSTYAPVHEPALADTEGSFDQVFGNRDVQTRLLHSGNFWAWGTLLVLLLLTGLAYSITKTITERAALAEFGYRNTEVIHTIEDRMTAYTQSLQGGLGLFRASSNVDRSEFRTYVDTLDLHNLFPGIQGLGYAEWVTPSRRNEYERSIRAQGYPDFKIRPSGVRDIYSSITYLEPFDERNRQAFGYDMFAQETRRRAMELARDTGEVAISGRVTLVQEITEDVQPGFLMYVPFYGNATPDDIRERRLKSRGFIYSAFRMHDLMQGILGRRFAEVRLQIYDDGNQTDGALMFDSAPDSMHNDPKFVTTKLITIGQRDWAIRTSSLPYFEQLLDRQKAFMILAAGVLTSVLVFGILWSLAGTRRRAQNIATRMTVSLNEAIQQAKDRQARISAVVETVVDGIITIDNQGNIETFNPAAEKIFGYTSAEITGMNVKSLMPQPFRKEHDTYLKNYRETKNAQVIGNDREVMGRRKDGSTFPMDLAIGEMVIDGRQMFTGIVRDISERKQIERMKSEFVATVSHELRTPLTSIVGSLGLLKADVLGELPNNIKSMLEIAHRNGDRLVHLLNDILDVEKMEAGKLEYVMQPLDITGLVTDAIEANKGYADTYGVVFAIGQRVPSAMVQADAARLMQVMSNLMSNAAKFSPKGDEIEISVAMSADLVRVTVQDRGPGIRPEYRDKIFEKFSQADSSDSRAKDGTGLGLNITKSIVESHGGKIDFDSEIGKGTAFYFELPLCHILSSQCAPEPQQQAAMIDAL